MTTDHKNKLRHSINFIFLIPKNKKLIFNFFIFRFWNVSIFYLENRLLTLVDKRTRKFRIPRRKMPVFKVPFGQNFLQSSVKSI